jgi:polyphosphate kinase
MSVKKNNMENELTMINRDLSWLEFNQRVLNEAEREDNPILECIKFLAITASNLDEYFMVRVGALQLAREQGIRSKDAAGLTNNQLWSEIYNRAEKMIAQQYQILHDRLLPELDSVGIHRVRSSELTTAQKSFLENYFKEQLLPVLTPVCVDDEDALSIPALQICLLFEIGIEEKNQQHQEEKSRKIFIALPNFLNRHISLPNKDSHHYSFINLEEVVALFAHLIFPSELILQQAKFRISRNSDVRVEEEQSTNLAMEMEDVLDARQTSSVIRLEIEAGSSTSLIKFLKAWVQAPKAQVFMIPGELDLKSYFNIASLSGFEELRAKPWPSYNAVVIPEESNLFDVIKKQDLLLHHPYDRFEMIVQFIEAAAEDPQVIAIKQILYRTAKNSRIIKALIRAAELGKQVTVLVELKARFDEARNLERAEDLMRAGVQIIYGVKNLKTHAKICMVLRRESGRLMRYIHFGTGNYNENTAKLYTDISLLTCRADYGADAAAFFNTVTGRSRFVHFSKISMAPFGLRERLLSLIQSESERASKGEPAEIFLKMNSLEDPQMIEALYHASQAGVDIVLNVRGICCLRAGVKGLSENIRVFSVIDNYLEHARIFYFRQGGKGVMFFASADFMQRNLSKRVELLIPVEDRRLKTQLLSILRTLARDNTRSWNLMPNNQWSINQRKPNTKVVRAQLAFTEEAGKQQYLQVSNPDVLIPHRPPKGSL